MTFATNPEPVGVHLYHDLAEPDFPTVTLPIPPVGPQFCRQLVVPLGTLAAGGGFGEIALTTPVQLDVYFALYVANATGTEILERTFTGIIPASPVTAAVINLADFNVAKGTDLSYNGTTHKIVSAAGGVFSAVLLMFASGVTPA